MAAPMGAVHKLMRAMMEDANAFPTTLRAILKEDLQVSVVEFAQASGIAQPTIYKLLSGEHEPNLRTVRLCVRAILALEGGKANGFVAVVAPPATLARLERDRIAKETGTPVKAYAAATVEDAIVAGVWAEREGAIALASGPLEAPYLRRAVTIDVHVPDPNEGLEAAVRRAAEGARRADGAASRGAGAERPAA
ncbi:MAG TPA: helix-turn-helix domain-containing protein [Anaeromyxobacter sp.]